MHGDGTSIPNDDDQSAMREVHSGYAVHELYINSKYGHLKEEMMDNMLCSLSNYQFAISAQKADLLCSSQRVKAMKSMKSEVMPSVLRYYGISEGAAVTKEHILSIVLYCDWQSLSDALNMSMKKLSTESLDDVKGRNCESAIWSKLLREMVEVFGGDSNHRNGYHHGVQCAVPRKVGDGLLHCSASSVCVFNAFNLRMAGPVRTSKNIRMASRSLTNQGILVQFRAPSGRRGVFDCSWISGHPQESEHFVMGGMDRVRIENITEMKGNRSHLVYFKALNHLQSMITDNDSKGTSKGMATESIDEKDHQIIRNLTDKSYFAEYPEYINCSFFAFCHDTTSIVLDLHWIYTQFGALSDLVIHSAVKSPYLRAKSIENEEKRKGLWRESLIRLFPNLKRIMVRSGNEQKQYPLSLTAMMSSIDCIPMFFRNEIQIEVTAQWRSPQKRSWIFDALKHSETMKCITTKAVKSGLVITPCVSRRGSEGVEDVFVVDHVSNLSE